MTTVKNLQFWLISLFFKGNSYNFKAVDNPKDLTPTSNYSDLQCDLWKWECYPWFFQTVSHILFFFFLLAENNLLAGVSKGKCYPNCYVTFRTGKIISLGVLSLCMCVHMHVWFTSESQLVVHTQNQLLQWMPIWFPAFPSLVLKITVFE